MNLRFLNVEAAYQASKCNSLKEAKTFCTMTGKEAKKASKNIEVKKNWDYIKYDIMSQLVFQKFLNDLKLREKLVDTWPKYLEETNTWKDTYWGVYNEKGTNNLGKILMSVRSYFKELQYNENINN